MRKMTWKTFRSGSRDRVEIPANQPLICTMTGLAGMPSYFWLTASRLRKPPQDHVPYTTQALGQDLLRVRNAWDECQSHRERDAIYCYLTAVFDLVMWWKAEDRAISRARWALQLQRLDLPTSDEPFAAVILCTADRQKVDKRTRSKWSRVLRYAMEYKSCSESLVAFVRRKGGINDCAERFARCFGRGGGVSRCWDRIKFGKNGPHEGR
jgi:hypothetical protein